MYAFALLQNPPKVQVLLRHVSLKAICLLLSGGGYILLLREQSWAQLPLSVDKSVVR
jgi:hypothetical protein